MLSRTNRRKHQDLCLFDDLMTWWQEASQTIDSMVCLNVWVTWSYLPALQRWCWAPQSPAVCTNRSVEKFSPGQTRRLPPEELHLRLGDGGLVVEEEPGDGLAAGGRGQGALVPVVAPPVPGQQGVEGELGHVLGAAALGLHPPARLSDGPQEDVVILQVNCVLCTFLVEA